MMISKGKFNHINNWLLICILCTLFFRPISTAFIFIFTGFNLIFYEYLSFKKDKLKYFLILSIPFLLEILFLWENIGSNEIFKPIEKYLSFLIFPLFILSNYKEYKLLYIANWYRKILTLLTLFLLVRFIIIFPNFVYKYLRGEELWEMGYVIANSFGEHAPKVNMQLAFVVLLNLFFLLENFFKNKFFNVILLVISTFELIIINTRLSLVSTIICSLIVVLFYARNKYRKKSTYMIGGFIIIVSSVLITAFYFNPYMKVKYSNMTFSNMDKIGKLDEVENPDGVLHNALVTRLSIWKSTIELAKENIYFGYGSANAKNELFKYYTKTDQKFLSKYKFPVHNQFLDYVLRFGIIGLIFILFFFIFMVRVSINSKNIIGVSFILNFMLSCLFDDFLILFSGIVFCSIWSCLIIIYYLNRCNYDL